MANVSQNDAVLVTREVEVDQGVVVGGDRDRVVGVQPTFSPGGDSLSSGLNTGDGQVVSVRPGLRFADATIDTELVALMNHPEMEDFFRDTFPVANISASVLATWNNAATHEDGATGPAIVGVASDFNAFLVVGDGCMLETTDPLASGVSAPNLRPRAIKKVWDDGSQIDLEPLYVSGSVSDIAEPLINEGPLTATFDIGLPIKNQDPDQARTINLEFQYTDQPGGSFEMVTGLRCGTFGMSMDGKSLWTVNFGYIGMDYLAPTQATLGSGTINENAAFAAGTAIDAMQSGDDLISFWVGATTALQGKSLTSFSVDGDGSAQGVDNISGTRSRDCTTSGDIIITGSLTALHNHAISAILTNLTRNGNKVPIDWKVQDPAGNAYWFRIPAAMLDPGATTPGAKGSLADGTFAWRSQNAGGNKRTMIVQYFPAV